MANRALVTGAGIRLGRAMALELARLGHDVAVHYASSADGARETVEAIRGLGREAVALQADLLDETQSAALVERAAEALGGPLSTLVNSASIFEHDTLESATRGSWDRHIESNLRAPFVQIQRFAEQAPEPERGADGEQRARCLVVNMIDQRVWKPTPEFASYMIAKSGLWALTRLAAQALAPRVRVNAIGPGPALRGTNQSEDHFRRQRRALPLERGPGAEDVTAALAYLLSAPSVTGQMICVDGGQHLAWQTPEIQGVDPGLRNPAEAS